MREILFKAKRIDNGEWVEGYYVKTGEASYIVVPYSQADISGAEGSTIEVDANTICQFTGLTDKNGNKIWENDIVIGREGYCGNSKLPTREIEFKVEYSRGYYRWLDNADMYEFEVIGNIFDNPELMKEGQ